MIAASILPIFGTNALASPENQELFSHKNVTNVSMIFPDNQYVFPSDEDLKDHQYRLYRAIIEFINDHYSNKSMPVWEKMPQEVDLDKRISNIVYWILISVQEHASIYFVDPIWIVAQIMEESFFYEHAISWSFASGICQFTMPTAQSFGMVTPLSSSLTHNDLRHAQRAEAYHRLQAITKRKKKLRNKYSKLFNKQESLFKDSLRHHVNETAHPRAHEWLNAYKELDSLETSSRKQRMEYMSFLQSNYQDKSIFNQQDLIFFIQFDERVTYKKPIDAMVKMMAQYMRSRNGNLLVATAGYNAGLSRTYYPYAVYEPYGRIPGIEQTVSYVSKIAVNHQEIVQRMV